VDAAEATRLLNQLLPQIEDSLFDALPAFKALRELLTDTVLDGEIKLAGLALEALNFQETAERLRRMASAQGWSLSV
jgi:hydroxymethylglutaryl-CoA reductase